MHLKQKGHCVGVLLLYTITTISSPSVGRREPPHTPQPSSHLDLYNVRNRDLTTASPSYAPGPEGRERQHQVFAHLGNPDRAHTAETSGGKPEQKMASSSSGQRFKNHQKLKQTEEDWLDFSNEDCSEGKVEHIIKGNFYIIGQLKANIPNLGYQSDSAVSVQAQGGQGRSRGQRLRGSEESWQKLQPVVECGDDAMTLVVRRRRAVHLLLDRGNESSVALSQLPPHCGYSVQTTWRDLSLMAHYDACHVAQEDDSYVLPLLWRGTPVEMSCPVSQTQPHATGLPSLCCLPYGMTVTVQGPAAAEELSINVRGEWSPLVVLAEQCGYVLDTRGAETVITAPYLTCGITVKDGKFTLSLQIGEKSFTLSCPVSPAEELPLTGQPLVSVPHHLSRGLTKPLPETLQPFPWAPPFYLAPLYYPHPTYHHKNLRPDVHDAHNPPTPSSSTPDPAFVPQPLPPADSQPDYQEYDSHQIPVGESYEQLAAHGSLSSADEMEDSGRLYQDLQRKQGPPVSGVSEKHGAARSPCSATPGRVEAPSLGPPGYAFNPYYHYYHHPKIPLPGPDPDPGPGVPEELSSTNSHTREFPLLPPNVQQSEADSGQVPQPTPDAASHPYIPPAPHAHYPQSYPYHHHHYYYHFPHIARGEAQRLAPLHTHNTAAETNLPDDHPLSRSSVLPVHDDYSVNPDVDQPNAEETVDIENYSADRIKNQLSSEADDVNPELEDKKRSSTPASPAVQPRLPPYYSPEPHPVAAPPPEQPSSPAQSNRNPPPHPHNYHPHYHLYQRYYAPESLQSRASDPPLQSSSSSVQHPSGSKHQTTASPTELTYDVQNGRLHPYYYYYYYHLYQPKDPKDDGDLHPADATGSEKESSKSESQLPSDSDGGRMDLLVHAPEAGHPSIPWPQHSPFPSLYSHYMNQQHPRHPGGGEAEERPDRLKADTHTPSASPCSYPVKDCTVGQHFVFAMPDSVVEPTVAPLAHPSESSNVSCALQRLTSDPDVYIVPLDGCGVNKHVFGETVVHLLEVQGFHSLQQHHDSAQEFSPVRLMVECSSSPGAPGEARLHVMDQPPPPIHSTPATITVQLRIATDESFTSYHPEAHLPLSLMRGRPLYLEARLLDPPPGPDLVLLVHSCLAYTHAPYTGWMSIYNRFSSYGDSQLLSSPHTIWRIIISGFLSLPSDSSSYMEDPEIYFLCLTEVCSAAGGDCTVGWSNSPNGDV
ncbi:uncharacterized protein LOC111662472 isoform X3 [Seriola lalandi dorsalis]|uniref:uncharacterized protein LOC111662472 isoform X3 n=1 Tax=Seriola lalandi dorsalis TaxID=1841481 RepID=UPI000C6F6225|nr:uncharacterized protein LOC111662472 isoform X3 [Seriola lalandi dorsalis]